MKTKTKLIARQTCEKRERERERDRAKVYNLTLLSSLEDRLSCSLSISTRPHSLLIFCYFMCSYFFEVKDVFKRLSKLNIIYLVGIMSSTLNFTVILFLFRLYFFINKYIDGSLSVPVLMIGWQQCQSMICTGAISNKLPVYTGM